MCKMNKETERNTKNTTKYVCLNSIIKEASKEKRGNYENIKKEYTKKLKEIMFGLGVDISNYKTKTGYKIPEIIADIFKIYLEEESCKGSFISKIKNKNFDSITTKEKKEFLNKAVDKLKNSKKYDNDEIEIFKIKKLVSINYNIKMKEKIDEVTSDLERELKNIAKIDDKDGLIIVNDEKRQKLENYNYEYKKGLESIDVLGDIDRVVLSNYLFEMIRQTLNEWKKLVNISNEIKNVEIDDILESGESINNWDDVIYGEDLLEKAIKEYNKSLNRNRINISKETLKEAEEFLGAFNK